MYIYIYTHILIGKQNSGLEFHEILRVNTATKGNLLRFDLMKSSVVLDSMPRSINTQILVDEPVLIHVFMLN